MLAAACTALLSSCQVISGLSHLTPDGPSSEVAAARGSNQTSRGYVETRHATGLLAGSFALEPPDSTEYLDAGEDSYPPCTGPMDSEDCAGRSD